MKYSTNVVSCGKTVSGLYQLYQRKSDNNYAAQKSIVLSRYWTDINCVKKISVYRYSLGIYEIWYSCCIMWKNCIG